MLRAAAVVAPQLAVVLGDLEQQHHHRTLVLAWLRLAKRVSKVIKRVSAGCELMILIMSYSVRLV